MQYIHLNDDSFVLRTSNGMSTLTRKSFNFNKIKRLLKKGAEEEKILPLLEPPKLPNGVFQAYLDLSKKCLMYTNLYEKDGQVVHEFYLMDGTPYFFDPNNSKFMGVYASKADLISDWPEYAI